MSIYKSSINKPVTTVLIFVAVMVIGLFSLQQLPIDQYPEIDPPYVMVMTTYAGANADEVETNVTKILENTLNSVDGLDELTSTSEDNISIVTLKMDWGTNLSEVVNDVRSYLDMVKDDLPSGCNTPYIFKFSTSSMPIAMYAITADESYPGLDKILNDEVIPQLNRVNGIGNLSLSGTPERYVYIDIDQAKLDAYGIPLETVGNAISNNNLNLSSGTVKMNDEQYQLQVRSEYAASAEIKDIVVTTTQNRKPVYVKDIATVRDTIKDLSLDERINSREGVRMIITKQSGANTVQICNDLKKAVVEVQKNLPSDIKMDVIYDSSTDIVDSINSLEESIFYALLFVILVVLMFLGKWRATVIIGLTIPIALIVSFVYLFAAGSSLNIISLSSLTVAIGMVVDDAIVVLENITKHIDRGESPREAAIYATNEVWISVIATTLVIVVVFLPLTMLTGIAGIFFKELGWIVTIVVSTSTLVAITLTPMLCSRLLKSKRIKIDEEGNVSEVKNKNDIYGRTVLRFLDWLDTKYGNVLRWCLHHKLVTMLLVVIVFIASLAPAFMGKIGTDFMQQSDNGRMTVTVELQQGTRIEETIKTARKLETRFEELAPEIRMITTTAGSSDDASISTLFNNTTNNKIQMTVVCVEKNKRERSVFDIAEVLRQEMSKYPEITEYQAQVASGMGSEGPSTVDVEVYGYNFDKTSLMAEDVKKEVEANVPGARNISISRDEDRAELKVVVDKEKLALHGLNSATVSSYVRNRVGGMASGYLKEDGDEYNILVRLKEEDRNSISDLQDLSIPTAAGDIIKLSEIAKVEEYWAPAEIARKSRQRVVTVSITPYKTSLGELAVAVQKAIDKIDKPQGITLRVAGDYEEQQETFADMGTLMALIIMLVYIVMASQFESFSKPFIIMMSIPFAISGVVLALFVTSTSLDMIGALGVIMLVGIVVKNGIVLVDYINLMRDRGLELNEAIAVSGSSRLRPVLMTAFTTILGMLPMALSTGSGSEAWKPMGIVVIGGLFASTLITLIVVPVFYALLSRHGERDKREATRKKFIFMQIGDEK